MSSQVAKLPKFMPNVKCAESHYFVWPKQNSCDSNIAAVVGGVFAGFQASGNLFLSPDYAELQLKLLLGL